MAQAIRIPDFLHKHNQKAKAQEIDVKCWCGKVFPLLDWEYTNRKKRSKSGWVFCSKVCSGRFATGAAVDSPVKSAAVPVEVEATKKEMDDWSFIGKMRESRERRKRLALQQQNEVKDESK